jgi:hypothetical protein
MNSKSWGRTLVTLSLMLAIFRTFSLVGLAAPQTTASISVIGQVTVNGTNTNSGTTILSDSTVTTEKNSSAVVSLGKLGRVEVLPQSTVKLSFNDAGLTCMLEAGRVRVSTSSGFNASVNTKDGVAVADNTQADAFAVDVECGITVVSTQSGSVELRTMDPKGMVKQITAGNHDSAGQPATGSHCAAGAQDRKGGVGAATLAGILLAAGGVIATAILLGRSEDEVIFGGTDIAPS